MSIDSALFAVHRGSALYQCAGSNLFDRLQTDDILAAYDSATLQPKGFVPFPGPEIQVWSKWTYCQGSSEISDPHPGANDPSWVAFKEMHAGGENDFEALTKLKRNDCVFFMHKQSSTGYKFIVEDTYEDVYQGRRFSLKLLGADVPSILGSYQSAGVVRILNCAILDCPDSVLFACTDDDGVTKSVTGAQFKTQFPDELPDIMPWDGHDGGIFHVTNYKSDEALQLTGGPFVAWNDDGSNQREITEIGVNKTVVFITSSNASGLFKGNGEAVEIDFNEYTDVSKVTDMSHMFEDCHKLELTRGMNNWDVSNVENFDSMLKNCWVWSIYVRDWNTKSATNMCSMFYDAFKMTQDISNWCVIKITSSSQYAEFNGNHYAWGWQKHPKWGLCPGGQDQA